MNVTVSHDSRGRLAESLIVKHEDASFNSTFYALLKAMFCRKIKDTENCQNYRICRNERPGR